MFKNGKLIKGQFDKQVALHITIIIIVALIPIVTWFRGDTLVTTSDFDFPNNASKTFLRSLSFWDDIKLGATNSRILATTIPWETLRLFLDKIGLSYSINEKIIFFSYHTLAGLGMYYLVWSIWNKRKFRRGALFAACFYIVNPMKAWFLVWQITPNYALLPMVLALFIKGVREKKGLAFIIQMTILWVLTTSSMYVNPVFAIADWIPLIIYVGCYLLHERNFFYRRGAVRFTAILISVWVILNAYWLIPAALSIQAEIPSAGLSAYGSSDVYAYQLNTLPMSGSLRLTGEWFLNADNNGDPYIPYAFVFETPAMIFISFLIPLLSFSAIICHRKDFNTIYFLLLSIIGILLVTGPNSPFGGIIKEIWSKTFIGSLFRLVLQKTGVYVLLGYSVLIGITLSSLESLARAQINKGISTFKLLLRNTKIIVRIPFIVIFILIVGIYSWVYWLGDYVQLFNGVNNPAQRVAIPHFYIDAARWLRPLGQDFRLAIIPTGLGYVNLHWQYGFLGPDTSGWLFDKSVYDERIKGVSDQISPNTAPYVDLSKIFRLLNVEYVMFHNDSNWRAIKDWPWVDYISPTQFKDLVKNQPNIVFQRAFGELDFYRIQDPLPHIYAAPEATIVSGEPLLSSLSGTPYLDGQPLVAFSQQQKDMNSLANHANEFVSTSSNWVDEALDLVGAEYHYRIAPENNEAGRFIFSVKQDGLYAVFIKPNTATKKASIENIDLIPSDMQEPNVQFLASAQNWRYLGTANLLAREYTLQYDGISELIVAPISLITDIVTKEMAALRDSSHRVAALLVPASLGGQVQQSNQIFSQYLPQDGQYSIRVHLSPRSQQSNIYLMPEQTDWQTEINHWTFSSSLSSLAGAPVTDTIELPFVLYGDNWYAEEQDSEQIRKWHWGKNNMQLLVFNPNQRGLQENISFCVTSIYKQDLEVRLNGQLIKTDHLPANYDQTPSLPLVDSLRRLIYNRPVPPYPYVPRVPEECTPVILDNISLKPGENEIRLFSPRGTVVLNDLLGNKDTREASLQLWDNFTFALVSKTPIEATSKDSIQPEVSVSGHQLTLTVPFEGASDKQTSLLMVRKFSPVDLEQYPFFDFRLTMSDPNVSTVETVFGIDYTGDGITDGYLTAYPTSMEDSKGQKIALNLFEAAKRDFSDPYYKEKRTLKLVDLYLVFHKRWGLEINNNQNRTFMYQLADLNFYNSNSVYIPNSEGSQNSDSKLPYPVKTLASEEDVKAIVKLFNGDLVKLDGQPLVFQSPIEQTDLLDNRGYWLDPATVSLTAGFHQLEIQSNSTFKVDLVEIANRPYAPKKLTVQTAFHKVNATRYNVDVDAPANFWLVFSETFNPDWKAYIIKDRSINDHPWYEWSALLTWFFERDRRIELTDHYEVNAYANGWYVPRAGQYMITLEYTPQRLYELGVVISVTSLLICLSYLGWTGLQRHQK